MSVHIFNPPNHPPQAPTYSHISTIPISSTKRLVSFAGQTSSTGSPTNNPDPDSVLSFPEQVRIALQNVDKCIAAAGCSKKDIVSNRQYVVGLLDLSQEDQKARGDIFLEWWRGTEGKEALPPPDTLIGVHSLARNGIKIEVEVTCVADI